MINNISDGSHERVSLQSRRFALSILGGLIVSLTALLSVVWLGKSSPQNGYFYTMMVMGALGVVLFLICLGPTKERYSTDTTANNQSSALDDLKTLLTNKGWRILFVLNVVSLIAVLLKGGTTPCYVNNIMERTGLGSLPLTTTLASGVVGAMLLPFIFKNTDKVKGFKLSMVLEVMLLIAMHFVPMGNVAAVFILVIIINIIQLTATLLQQSTLSNITDAEEKHNGKKPSGAVFSTNLFAIKLGIVVGGALVDHLLAWGGCVGGAAQQSASALQMVELSFTPFPSVLVALLTVMMNRYSLDDKRLSRMAQKGGRQSADLCSAGRSLRIDPRILIFRRRRSGESGGIKR